MIYYIKAAFHKKRNLVVLYIFFVFVLCINYVEISAKGNALEIRSCILRDRIIVMDKIVHKKALYVAFSTSKPIDRRSEVYGKLVYNNNLLSESVCHGFYGKNGNLLFDLPYDIQNGYYAITIELIDERKKITESVTKTIYRKELMSVDTDMRYSNIALPKKVDPEILNSEPYKTSETEINRGYIIYQRSPLAYIYEDSKPANEEAVAELTANVVKNEYESIPFSIYGLRDIGNINVHLEWTGENHCRFTNENITVNHIENVEEQRGIPGNSYQLLPSLIVPGGQILIKKNISQRLWLTLHVPKDTPPGTSIAEIVIATEQGRETRLPLRIIVNDISLEDIPDVNYFMLMTYEFTELVNKWKKNEKKQIYDSAVKILKDYKAHGMTALCIHSPFVAISDKRGNINLDDLKAALIAARDVGLKGPVIYYMGHLIQTAKPRHPGSIKGFEKEKCDDTLKNIIHSINRFIKGGTYPDLVLLPIDEPDDDYQDFHKKRFDNTIWLLKNIKEMGQKTALTALSYEDFKGMDIFITGKYNKKDREKARKNKCAYIVYNNRVTTECNNLSYARYIYGYYTWQHNLDGMCSWTFQNTQNASGHPKKADSHFKDIFLAYPDVNGPISTLMWEAIRDGIEDHKLIYQLEKITKKLESLEINNISQKRILKSIREKEIAFKNCFGYEKDDSTQNYLQKNKNNIIKLIIKSHYSIMKTDEKIKYHVNKKCIFNDLIKLLHNGNVYGKRG